MICSIIIRSYNEERHIGRLLDGIDRQIFNNKLQIEVILVDSGSTDATISIAKRMGAKVVNISNEEFSFGRALNLGCETAKGEILIFASAHVYPVYTDWIERLITPLQDENVALVYGRQIGNEFTKFSEHQVFSKWFPAQSNSNQRTPFCNNANCAIKKSLWLEQPYNEYLPGLEDIDWANKIILKNYKIYYEAEAIITHVHEETFSQIRNRYRREAIALKQIMPLVNFGLWEFISLFFVNVLNDLIQAIQEQSFYREFNRIICFRFNQFLGTYLGYKQKGIVTKELKNKFYYPKIANRKIIPESERSDKKILY